MDMRRSTRTLCVAGAALLAGLTGGAPAGLAQMAPETVATEAAFFPVGERLEYSISLGRIRLGHATMRVEAEETLDGVLTYRTSLHIRIGAALLNFEDRLISWIEPEPFRSRAFARRDPDADGRLRYYRFDPDEQRATAEQREPNGSTVAPLPPLEGIPIDVLDELAALYLLRTLSVGEGETHTIDRYFDPSIAPMELTALETIRMRVPAGRFETTVFRTVMPALPAFQAENDPRIYVSRGDDRLIVQIETDTKIGRLRMYLTDYEIPHSEVVRAKDAQKLLDGEWDLHVSDLPSHVVVRGETTHHQRSNEPTTKCTPA